MLKVKNKKMFYTASLVLSTAFVGLVTISCGNTKAPAEDVKVTNIDTTRVAALPSDFNIATAPKMVVITDTGKVTDRSFNESAWEAVEEVKSYMDKVNNGAYKDKINIRSIETRNNGYTESYQTALNNGYNLWVLPGFGHKANIQAFWAANKDEMVKKGITIIGVDFNPSEVGVPTAHSMGLKFKVQESAFVVGYGAAKYLADTVTDKNQRVLSTFGGGTDAGVTDFNRGFLSGVAFYNKHVASPEQRVKMNSNQVALNSGFQEDATMAGVVTASLEGNPKIILPVAGPATGSVLRSSGPEQLVIGVDVNQSFAYRENAGRFFSSIEKNIGQAVFESIMGILNKTGTLSSTESNDKFKGIADKYTGYSAPTISNADLRQKAADALAAGLAAYNNATNSAAILAFMEADSDFHSNVQTKINALATQINTLFGSTDAAQPVTVTPAENTQN